MLKITEAQKKLLLKYFPNYEESEDFFADLDEIMSSTLDDDGESTKETAIISKLYDELFIQN